MACSPRFLANEDIGESSCHRDRARNRWSGGKQIGDAVKRVLVSGASGIVGYGVFALFRQAGQEEICLVGTSIYDDSVAPAFCDVFEQAPLTGTPEYLTGCSPHYGDIALTCWSPA